MSMRNLNRTQTTSTEAVHGRSEKKSKKTSKVLVLLISVYLYISAAKLPGKFAPPSGEFLSPLDIDRS